MKSLNEKRFTALNVCVEVGLKMLAARPRLLHLYQMACLDAGAEDDDLELMQELCRVLKLPR